MSNSIGRPCESCGGPRWLLVERRPGLIAIAMGMVAIGLALKVVLANTAGAVAFVVAAVLAYLTLGALIRVRCVRCNPAWKMKAWKLMGRELDRLPLRRSAESMTMTTQPIPTVTGADVERIVRRDFRADRAVDVLAMLDEYGTETWQAEPHRVRLAALKLAAGDIKRLRHEIDLARGEYRDVLAPAEYPAYIEHVFRTRTPPQDDEWQRIIDADRKQYQDWLTR